MITILQLFWAFFQIGLFSIGGGYAALGLIQQQAVETYGWITQAEYLDLITIAEMTPGPITLNSATFVGVKVGRELGGSALAGVGGAVVATLACILPAIIIISILAHIYYKYRQLDMVQGVLNTLHPAVVGIIGATAINIIFQSILGGSSVSTMLRSGFTLRADVLGIVLFIGAIIVLIWKKPNPILVIVSCGFIGVLAYFINPALVA